MAPALGTEVTFAVASYNVLATAHIKPHRYPGVSPSHLDPSKRNPRVVRRVASLGADVICLQEVEPAVHEALRRTLEPDGYESIYAHKGAGEPDGCAMYFNKAALTLRSSRVLHFAESPSGEPLPGHVAALAALEARGRRLGVATVHLKRDRPDTALEDRIGYLQAVRLLDELNDFDPGCHAWIMCGDFNAAPSDEIVRLIRARGFLDAYGDAPEPFTCVTKTGGKRVDYLFHLPTLSSRPMALPAISGTTLPNDREPSDHLAVAAEFDWDAS